MLLHFLEFGTESPLRQTIEDLLGAERPGEVFDAGRMDAVFTRVENGLRARVRSAAPPNVAVGRLRKWLPYAAAALLAVALGSWLLTLHTPRKSDERQTAAASILPGSNRATLTLSNGHTIALSESQEGIVVGEGVTYTDGSEVVDAHLASPSAHGVHALAQLTLTTPRGGIYRLTLPDGSNVWLNAKSVLKYPREFAAHERVVFLTGEAYFEVTKAQRPFRVVSEGQTVEVLGTAFNVSAYPDDAALKTTLVEGSVKVHAGSAVPNDATLSPGEQSTLSGGILRIGKVDTEQYVAWKDNEFMFEEASIADVMKALERWYDVNVVYEGPKPADRFGGGISRFEDASKVLKLLEQAGDVRFRVDGRTIYVKKKTE